MTQHHNLYLFFYSRHKTHIYFGGDKFLRITQLHSLFTLKLNQASMYNLCPALVFNEYYGWSQLYDLENWQPIISYI